MLINFISFSLNGFLSRHLGSMATNVSDLEVYILFLDLEASYHDILVNRSCAELPASWCRGLGLIPGQLMCNVMYKMALGQFSLSLSAIFSSYQYDSTNAAYLKFMCQLYYVMLVKRRGHCIKHHYDIVFVLFFGLPFREAYRVSESG